jgi:beta-lactamase regulating signal transducer with metallopeptidase domain
VLPWSFGFSPPAVGAAAELGPASAPPDWLKLVALLHLAGILVTLAVCGAQVLWLRRLRRSSVQITGRSAEALTQLSRRIGLKRTPAAVVAPEVAAPFAVGLRSPTIFLPRGREAENALEALEPLLAHELVHLRTRDLWVAWLGTLARVVWWFHPLVRRLVRASEAAREQRCDDIVLAESLADRRAYALALLDAAEAALPRLTVPHFASASLRHRRELESRLERITQDRPRRGRLSAAEVFLLMVVAAMALPAMTRPGPPADEGEPAHWVHAGGHGFRHAAGHGQRHSFTVIP